MRLLPAAAILLLFAGATAAVPEPVFPPAAIKAHVDFLADDLLEGRDAGSRGHDLAARYVASRFAALGLTPAADGDWLQPVPLRERTLAGPPPMLEIGGTRFAHPEDFIAFPDAPDTPRRTEAEVVFAGYGLDSPRHGFDDYRGLDVRGKLVALLSGYPAGMPGALGVHLAAQKANALQRRGAIGAITIPTLASDRLRPWARLLPAAGSSGLSWLDADGRPWSGTPSLKTSALLNRRAAEALFAGERRSLAQVLAEADRPGGRPRGFALAHRIAIERSSAARDLLSANVVAILPGTDPALAKQYVLMMAHLDHQGINPKLEGDRIYNGAMDNAAGVATMIEVARALSESPVRPRRPILFAAVTAEEDGLLGAHYLAKHPVVGDGRVVAVVNLDMPVLLYDFTDIIAFGAEHSTLGPLVAQAAQRMGVSVTPDPIPHENIFTRSDHYRFVQEGIPSIYPMTGFANGGEARFRDFLATHYHQVTDAPDLPFDWTAAAKFARLNHRIIRAIADADTAPQWYLGDLFGAAYAPGAPKAAPP